MSPERLEAIRVALDQTPIIVEHWFFYGSRSPDRFVFEDYEEFVEYLTTNARPGDSIWTWRSGELCRGDNPLTHGKVPDENGLKGTGVFFRPPQNAPILKPATSGLKNTPVPVPPLHSFGLRVLQRIMPFYVVPQAAQRVATARSAVRCVLLLGRSLLDKCVLHALRYEHVR